MRHELTAEQIDFYRENGYLVIENFLDADELAEWRRCTDESVTERLGGSVEVYDKSTGSVKFLCASIYTMLTSIRFTLWYAQVGA